jgi:hypothetical protein
MDRSFHLNEVDVYKMPALVSLAIAFSILAAFMAVSWLSSRKPSTSVAEANS